MKLLGTPTIGEMVEYELNDFHICASDRRHLRLVEDDVFVTSFTQHEEYLLCNPEFTSSSFTLQRAIRSVMEPLFQALKDENPNIVTVSRGYREPICFDTENNIRRRQLR